MPFNIQKVSKLPQLLRALSILSFNKVDRCLLISLHLCNRLAFKTDVKTQSQLLTLNRGSKTISRKVAFERYLNKKIDLCITWDFSFFKGGNLKFFNDLWGGQGGGRPGEKGAGGVREAGEEGAGSGIPKVAGSRRKREKLCNIAQYFAIEKMQRGGSQKIQGGNRD